LCLEATSSYLWDTELRPGNAGTWDGSVELLASCFHQRTISSESRASSMLRQSLVASQVAVSLVLLVGAIAFAGTLANPRNLDPGFRNDRVLTMSVELPEGDVKAGKSAALWRSIADSVPRHPRGEVGQPCDVYSALPEGPLETRSSSRIRARGRSGQPSALGSRLGRILRDARNPAA